jgi:hypothetical protein
MPTMDSHNTLSPGLSTPVAAPYPALWYGDLLSAGAGAQSWIWQGYLGTGQVTLLTSQWKLGKSTLLAALMARMKTGGELAGLPVSAGKVVVVSEESPSKWYERGQGLSFGDHLCWFCRPFLGRPRLDDWLALIDQIASLHARHGVALVVIDPLANLTPLRCENDAGEMLKTLLPLQRLTALGLSVLLLHHPRKGPVVMGQAARGSGALSGYVDIIIEMQRVSRRNLKDRRRRLLAYSRHETTPTSRAIELTDDGTDYRFLGESTELDFEHGWPLLKNLLAEAAGPLTREELHRDWPEGLFRAGKLTLWRWLARAVKERLVECHGAGSRTEPYRYKLPGMEMQWQAKFNEEFQRKLERGE